MNTSFLQGLYSNKLNSYQIPMQGKKPENQQYKSNKGKVVEFPGRNNKPVMPKPYIPPSGTNMYTRLEIEMAYDRFMHSEKFDKFIANFEDQERSTVLTKLYGDLIEKSLTASEVIEENIQNNDFKTILKLYDSAKLSDRLLEYLHINSKKMSSAEKIARIMEEYQSKPHKRNTIKLTARNYLVRDKVNEYLDKLISEFPMDC